jgi:phage N-6-adenine-methyltransferase
MNNKLMFSSERETWETPQDFFDLVNKEFNFDVDVCALPNSAKCKKYYTPEIDALKQKWEGVCWMNPPYARVITGKWVEYAQSQAVRGTVVVALLPARTDTVWFHDAMVSEPAIMFLKGRLKFGGAKNAAPFPSCLIVFSDNQSEARLKLLNLPAEIQGFIAL